MIKILIIVANISCVYHKNNNIFKILIIMGNNICNCKNRDNTENEFKMVKQP